MKACVSLNDVEQLRYSINQAYNRCSTPGETFKSDIKDAVSALKAASSASYSSIQKAERFMKETRIELGSCYHKKEGLESEFAVTPRTIKILRTDCYGNEYYEEVPNPRYDELVNEIKAVSIKIAELDKKNKKYEEIIMKLNANASKAEKLSNQCNELLDKASERLSKLESKLDFVSYRLQSVSLAIENYKNVSFRSLNYYRRHDERLD